MEAGAMAQCLKAVTAPIEDQGLIPRSVGNARPWRYRTHPSGFLRCSTYVAHTLTHPRGKSHDNKAVFKMVRLRGWHSHPRRLVVGQGHMGATSSPEPIGSPSAHSTQSRRFPPSPRGLACWLPRPPASTSAGSDLWSLRGGWRSQERNKVAD